MMGRELSPRLVQLMWMRFRDLRLVADIEPNPRERKLEDLESIAFLGLPFTLGREDVGLNVNLKRAVWLEQMTHVYVTAIVFHAGASRRQCTVTAPSLPLERTTDNRL